MRHEPDRLRRKVIPAGLALDRVRVARRRAPAGTAAAEGSEPRPVTRGALPPLAPHLATLHLATPHRDLAG